MDPIIENVNKHDSVKIYRDARVRNCIIHENVIIGDFALIDDCIFENNVMIQRRDFISGTYIGRYSNIGLDTKIRMAEIGQFTSISWNCSIGGPNHKYNNVSTCILDRNNKNFCLKDVRSGKKIIVHSPSYIADSKCIIGNDVWIGANAQILRNVKVGDGAVVAAGAIVTKDVEPYTIVAGVPAKVIKYRFTKDVIEKMMQIKWWNLPEEVIHDNLKLFNTELSDSVIRRLEQLKQECGV